MLKAVRIRIVLLPLGGISQETFEKYSKIIQGFDRVELAELTPLLTSTSLNSMHLYNKAINKPLRCILEANWIGRKAVL